MTNSLFARVITRPVAFAALAMIPGLLLVCAIWLLNPGASRDELIAGAGVPLVSFYVFGRVFDAFVKPISDEHKDRAEAYFRAQPRLVLTFVNLQAVLLLLVVVMCLSAPFYAYLGMTQAWVFSLRFAGILTGAAAMFNVLAGMVLLAKESHQQGGFVRRCHALYSLVWYLITEGARETRRVFDFVLVKPAH